MMEGSSKKAQSQNSEKNQSKSQSRSPLGTTRKRLLSPCKMIENNNNNMSFDSPHSVHTRSTTATTISPASLLSQNDDDYEDFCNSDSEFDGESSFANLGLDEKDGDAERELQNLIAKQALENFRIRKDSVLGGGPQRTTNLNREPSFRGSLELIEE